LEVPPQSACQILKQYSTSKLKSVPDEFLTQNWLGILNPAGLLFLIEGICREENLLQHTQYGIMDVCRNPGLILIFVGAYLQYNRLRKQFKAL
jgi:hypothetical protein